MKQSILKAQWDELTKDQKWEFLFKTRLNPDSSVLIEMELIMIIQILAK